MSKIYTRTGDTGETALRGGFRVPKDNTRLEAIGHVDELNASLGVVRAELARSGTAPPDLDSFLTQLQHQLFNLGAELAALQTDQHRAVRISDQHVAALEAAIDRYDAPLEPLQHFILPGGAPAAAHLHLARCIARRAERQVVRLMGQESTSGELLRYLNRMSDLLFVLARAVNRANSEPDVIWNQDQS
jgi:cob(I)alamin adenosyltransferase